MKNIIMIVGLLFSLAANCQQNTIFTSLNGSANFAWTDYPTMATAMNAVVTTGSYSNPAWLTSVAWSKISSFPGTTSQYIRGDGSVATLPIQSDSVRFYNKSGRVAQVVRVFTDSFGVNNSNGGVLDISAAGFTTIISVSATAYKNTATATSVANVGIKSYTTTTVTLNLTEGNNSLVSVLGFNVLQGASNAFANTTGLFVHITIIGY